MNAVPFVLFAYGETEVSSLLAGIFNSLTPLMTLLFSLVVLPDEPPTPERIAGHRGRLRRRARRARALAGDRRRLAARRARLHRRGDVLRPGVPLHAPPPLGPARDARWRSRPRRSSLGGLLLLLVAPLGELPDELPGVEAWLSILALGALGTGVAYVLNFNVVRAAGAQTGSMVTYLVPVFAVVFGVSILGEPLSWHEPAGGALIIAGVALAQRRPARRPSTL